MVVLIYEARMLDMLRVNVQRVPRTESTLRKKNVQCHNCNGKGYYAREVPKSRVHDVKYFMKQMLQAAKDEVGVNLDAKENEFMLMNAYGDDQLEELSASMSMMERIQPTDDKFNAEPTYDVELISEDQHQREGNELIEYVNQKTYAYGDVCSKNQDLLMTISELKAKLKTFEKGKNVNTKIDESTTLGKLICVTQMNKTKDLKVKMVSKVEGKNNESKPVTSCSKPKNELEKKKNANETLAEENEGALHLGPERVRVYSDLSPDDKDRYTDDILAINILLQGLPKDIYTLINHYTNAKDIWDNVKMLLEGSELTKKDRESQLYDDFEHFHQNKGETVYDYYVRVDITEVKGTIQGAQVQLVMEGFRIELGMQILVKLDILSVITAMENGVVLVEEQLLFLVSGHDTAIDEDMDEPSTMFMANLSSVDPVYDEAGSSYDSDILSEVQEYDNYQDAVCEHHEAHEMHHDVQPNCVDDSNADYTSDNNMILYDQRSYVFEKDFKQKENKYLEEFLDMKALKEKVEDKLFKQDQSLQIVHMLCKPRPHYDEQIKVAIGYKNPLYLTRAKQV
nr:integrase, catalytic region, zinc finger, CCHC-type, peptidase aspartic, catalytic [Tanacetum cinerariifolium]